MSSFVGDKIMLIKLQAAEKAALASASLIKILIISVLSFFILLIVTFLAGYYLSQLTNSYGIGFGIVAVIYFLLILYFSYNYKKHWNKKIADKIVGFFFTETD